MAVASRCTARVGWPRVSGDRGRRLPAALAGATMCPFAAAGQGLHRLERLASGRGSHVSVGGRPLDPSSRNARSPRPTGGSQPWRRRSTAVLVRLGGGGGGGRGGAPAWASTTALGTNPAGWGLRGVQWVATGRPAPLQHGHTARLAEVLAVPYISMGTLVTQELNPASQLYRKIANSLNEGMLVPEDIIFGLLRNRLEEGYKQGIGFLSVDSTRGA